MTGIEPGYLAWEALSGVNAWSVRDAWFPDLRPVRVALAERGAAIGEQRGHHDYRALLNTHLSMPTSTWTRRLRWIPVRAEACKQRRAAANVRLRTHRDSSQVRSSIGNSAPSVPQVSRLD